MDSFYDYIWDVTILEYLTRILLMYWFMRGNYKTKMFLSFNIIFPYSKGFNVSTLSDFSAP